jgi:glutathione S-transferase
MAFMEDHLTRNDWFAGARISLADFQMSFPVEAALARCSEADRYRYAKLNAYRERLYARPAYRRAIAKGGPVVMA